MNATDVNVIDLYRQALAIDTSANEPETNHKVARLMEQVFIAIAAEAFDGPDLTYILTEPTSEKRQPRYGGGEPETVWRTWASDEYDPTGHTVLRGIEQGDIRIVGRNGRLTGLSFEVQALDETTFEDTNVREDRFGFRASVSGGDSFRKPGEPAEVSWGSNGTRTIEAAEAKVRVYQTAIRLAHIIDSIITEVYGK